METKPILALAHDYMIRLVTIYSADKKTNVDTTKKTSVNEGTDQRQCRRRVIISLAHPQFYGHLLEAMKLRVGEIKDL